MTAFTSRLSSRASPSSRSTCRARRSTPCRRRWARSSTALLDAPRAGPGGARRRARSRASPTTSSPAPTSRSSPRSRTAEDATALSRRAQELVKRIAAARQAGRRGDPRQLPRRRPRAGARLPLAHRHRPPEDPARLPEVQLGILPGAGGCIRLPRLIGAPRRARHHPHRQDASGPRRRGRSAWSMSWSHPAILREMARARRRPPGARGRARARNAKRGAGAALLDRTVHRAGRSSTAARKQLLLKKTGGHYPAPLAALEVVRTGLEQRRGCGLRRRGAAVRRARGHRRLAQPGAASSSPRTALKKDDGVPPGAAGDACPRWCGWASWARLHGRRASRERRCSRPRSKCACATPTCRRVGEGPQGRHGPPRRAAEAAPPVAAAAPAARGAALRHRTADQRVSRGRPRHRGGVRGPRRQADRDGASSRPVAGRRRGHRDQHVDHSHRRHRRHGAAPRAHPRHALLLAGGEDAAARGHPARGHVGARRRALRCASAGGWARPSSWWPTGPASGSTASSRPTSTRPGSLLLGGRADRGHRPRDDALRVSGGSGDAARRGRARRGAEGRGRHARGLRRAPRPVRGRRPHDSPTGAWAARAGRASTATRTARRHGRRRLGVPTSSA